MIVAASRGGGNPRVGLLSDGCLNVLLGLLIASQWPVSGLWTIGIYVGFRILASGWSKILGREIPPATRARKSRHCTPTHACTCLRTQSWPNSAECLSAEDEARYPIDRYWRVTFLLTFLAMHVGRMDAEWNLVGLLSPAVAVFGDVLFALVLAWGVITLLCDRGGGC